MHLPQCTAANIKPEKAESVGLSHEMHEAIRPFRDGHCRAFVICKKKYLMSSSVRVCVRVCACERMKEGQKEER
jgi:hypothetical protein